MQFAILFKQWDNPSDFRYPAIKCRVGQAREGYKEVPATKQKQEIARQPRQISLYPHTLRMLKN